MREIPYPNTSIHYQLESCFRPNSASDKHLSNVLIPTLRKISGSITLENGTSPITSTRSLFSGPLPGARALPPRPADLRARARGRPPRLRLHHHAAAARPAETPPPVYHRVRPEGAQRRRGCQRAVRGHLRGGLGLQPRQSRRGGDRVPGAHPRGGGVRHLHARAGLQRPVRAGGGVRRGVGPGGRLAALPVPAAEGAAGAGPQRAHTHGALLGGVAAAAEDGAERADQRHGEESQEPGQW